MLAAARACGSIPCRLHSSAMVALQGMGGAWTPALATKTCGTWTAASSWVRIGACKLLFICKSYLISSHTALEFSTYCKVMYNSRLFGALSSVFRCHRGSDSHCQGFLRQPWNLTCMALSSALERPSGAFQLHVVPAPASIRQLSCVLPARIKSARASRNIDLPPGQSGYGSF